ncbi:MAG: PIN domain-containing protein [Gammaproteobacteria bacterium]|nr:PIN domain-containing protein [Gammaproteobacteria bacterium]
MRLLLDINILLDLAFQRPGAPASAALISACGRQHQGFLAWHTLVTLAYLIERQGSAQMARAFIGELLTWADIAPTTRTDAVNALAWSMPDYEDALQAAAALACGASWIITRNQRDFAASPVPTLTPEDFFARYPAT